MVLLDNDFLVDLMAEDPDAVAALDEFDWRDASVSILTVSRIRDGLPESKRERFDELVRQLEVLPYEFDAGRTAVDEHKRLHGEGHRIEAVDAMIAGTAIEADEPILTNDPETFEPTKADVVSY